MKNARNRLEYKGYHTHIEFDSEGMILYGKIEGIDDFVDFQSESATKIEQEFHDAVDDYLQFCQKVGKEPDRQLKDTANSGCERCGGDNAIF